MDKCFEVLNGQSEHIRFTQESPNGGWLPFLNTQLLFGRQYFDGSPIFADAGGIL
ncbi:hypothetical protein KIN20_033731 [Parelaphostrongylus tenuis]|uniref:Uncharacterized protein n=1 Tax=Parelaphostrongylus tenuis TaxID=148309 RepID=A0AAD5WIH2_PARTN|nr:hypothetical protein KIN20_033731 [Parelaphostrongylus tenuis]